MMMRDERREVTFSLSLHSQHQHYRCPRVRAYVYSRGDFGVERER